MKKYKICIYGLISMFMTLMLSACQDEFLSNQESVEPGLDTETIITVSLPQMDVKTRAEMNENLLNRVNTLWIGIYNSKSGERMTAQTITGLAATLGNHATAQLKMKCKTGPSYIVAVANPNSSAYGAAVVNSDGSVTNTPLSTALQNADTWDKYKGIAIRQLTQGNVNMPNPPLEQGLVMTGFFIANDNVSSHPVNSLGDIQSVIIPFSDNLDDDTAVVPKLDGIIHLRRPFAQVKFNIELAGTDLESFELADIQMFNLPQYTWVHERTGESNTQTGAPVGDRYSWTNASDAIAGNYTDRAKAYTHSLIFLPTSMETTQIPAIGNVVAHTRYSMDFWMFENRHTGLETCTEYTYREREYLNGEMRNTGIYQSLSSETPTLNNCASYARIRGTLKYKTGVTLPGAASDVEERVADVDYIVHLGYVNPDKDPRDFNTLRNSIYTYNVTVSGCENIRIEAFQEGNDIAPQPSAEGIVTDITNEFFELDSHYAAFNIQLTAAELNGGCTFAMTSYYGDEEYNFDNSDNATGVNNYPKDESDPNWKFYSWVELRRTTGQNVLANYPTLAERSGTNPIYHLADLANPDMQPGWYTVFVNEYTYEDESYAAGPQTHNEGTNWRDYTNLPDRKFWIRVTEEVSPDGESMYCRAKYAVSQKSIQTYYDDLSETAVGLEHTNEVFGMNSRWTLTANNLEGDNGRYNVWANVGGSDNGTRAGSWSTYVRTTTPTHVNAITNAVQPGPAGISTAARDFPLPMVAALTGQTANQYDPQTNTSTAQFFEDLYACMNRNRDLNGDGNIDAHELRWYVPSTGNYVRVLNGRNSLATPIINYTAERLAYNSGSYYNTLYHFFTSDNQYLWCEEGMSSAGIYNGYSSWEVRCIRNLGTDLSTVSRNAKIEQAYDDTDWNPNTAGGVVKVAHYYGTSLRALEPEYVPMHKTNSLYNRIGMYGFEYAPRGNVIYTTPPANIDNVNEATVSYASFDAYNQAVINASPCADLNRTSGRTGWRVPNQKELVIIRRVGALKGQIGFMGCTQEYWSNTDGVASTTPGPNFRITTVKETLATAQSISQIGVVRCVRDLTEEEQYKTYNQIVNNN